MSQAVVGEVYFEDRDRAEEFAEAAGHLGYVVESHRAEFAGEDDAEDSAWVVLVWSPDGRLSELVGHHGGWLTDPVRGLQYVGKAAELPDGPRRVKNPKS